MRVRVDRRDSGGKEIDVLRMTPSLVSVSAALRSIRSSLGGQVNKVENAAVR